MASIDCVELHDVLAKSAWHKFAKQNSRQHALESYLSNGRFKNADHQAVVNSNYSRLSIATFQNLALEAIVYPLKVRAGEKPVLEESITFFEMYKRKMSKDLELSRLKKLARDKQLNEETNVKPESIEDILA
ncbi:Naringenin [Forsythia ovata]|uniref:Naringenin n=1 Tax=Forsythia ovata TaxID=205694 RepID=A0ABD1RMR1_9LAMI